MNNLLNGNKPVVNPISKDGLVLLHSLELNGSVHSIYLNRYLLTLYNNVDNKGDLFERLNNCKEPESLIGIVSRFLEEYFYLNRHSIR